MIEWLIYMAVPLCLYAAGFVTAFLIYGSRPKE